MTIEKFDPFSAGFQNDRYTTYQYYRENDPVHWGASASPWREGTWYIFNYTDVEDLLSHPGLGKDAKTNLPDMYVPPADESSKELARIFSQLPFFQDPPMHTRSRKIMQTHFNPRLFHKSASQIQDLINLLLADIDTQEFDLVDEVTLPLPLLVIGSILGVPLDDAELMKELTIDIMLAVDLKIDQVSYTKAGKTALALYEYLKDLLSQRKKAPKQDLLSAFLGSQKEDNTTDDEIIGYAIFLLIAGYGTTSFFLAKAIYHLLLHSDQLNKLLNEPGLMSSAIEELLRYKGIFHMIFRYAFEDISIHNKKIKRGDHIALVIGSANHDPHIFQNPLTFDIARPHNKHLTFGLGQRYCSGANLARLQGKLLIQTLFSKFPSLDMISPPEQSDQIGVDALKSLYLTTK